MRIGDAVKNLQSFVVDKENQYLIGRLVLVVAVFILMMSHLKFLGFIQDDAYISLRYSYNLVEGNGLVFNPGERVEGYSNFSWTMLGAFFLAIGVDAILSYTLIGVLSAYLLLVMIIAISREVREEARPIWDALPALLLAGSTTIALWSLSALEQVPFALCGWTAFLMALKGRPRIAGALLLLVMLTRPEGVLFFLFTSYLALHFGRFEVIPKRTEFFKVAALVVIAYALYQYWRFSYFGEPFPNTYYVKGGGGLAAAIHGWMNFKKLMVLNGNGLLMLLAPFALLCSNIKGRVIMLAFLIFQVGYCLYEIKIGGDFLDYYRLHLTTLPAQCFLAVKGVENICRILLSVSNNMMYRNQYVVRSVVVGLLLGPALIIMIVQSWYPTGHRNVGKQLEAVHGDIGRYLTEIAQPGDVVLAQDMGATPWYAQDLVFVDAVGLVDKTIAHLQYDYGYNPQIRYILWRDAEARIRIKEMEAKLRAYTFSRKPKYAVVNVYYPREDNLAEKRKALETNDQRFFHRAVFRSAFYNKINTDDEWKKYRLIRGWEHSPTYFLLLFERTVD